MYIHLFKTLDLDMLLVSMSAPGCSAFNYIERRMAPLSRWLVGLVLDYAKFGAHLNAKKETIDIELEKKNFANAGKVLAEIWSEKKIDENIVTAEYIAPLERKQKEEEYEHIDWKWADSHVKFGCYHLSIMKCQDVDCCGDVRSNYYDILQSNYYPAPRFFIRAKGIVSLGNKFKHPPKGSHYASLHKILALQKGFPHGDEAGDTHDDYNPLFNAELLKQTQCRVCLKYFPSKKTMLLHRKKVHPRSQVNNLNIMDGNADDDDYESLLTEAEKEYYANIDRIKDERDGQWLAVMKDGSESWVELDATHALVIKYIATRPGPQAQALPTISDSDLTDWATEPFIPDTDFKVDDDADAARG